MSIALSPRFPAVAPTPAKFTVFVQQRRAKLAEANLLDIAEDIAARHGTNLEEMVGVARSRHVCAARGELVLLMRDRLDWSYDSLSNFFGREDKRNFARMVKRHERAGK